VRQGGIFPLRLKLNLNQGAVTLSRLFRAIATALVAAAIGPTTAPASAARDAAVPDRPCSGGAVLERTAHVMGTLLTIRVEEVERACAVVAVEAAFAEVARLEAVLSSWIADSEVGLVNAAAPGTQVAASSELTGLLAEAGIWVERTGGAFDPAMGALVDAWDLRGAGRWPDSASLEAARAASGWSHLSIVAPGELRRGPAGWWLDTGAFGKGAALRSAAVQLERHGITRALLDFGGQLLVVGAAESVGVAHPAERGREVARVRLDAGRVSAPGVVAGTGPIVASLATTSSSERFVEVDGTRLGHVLDPRTGRPVAAWGSVTVLARDALVADALSTALYVMGPAMALEWAARREVAVLVLELDGEQVRARWTDAMAPHVINLSGEHGS
jgi:FAD:protein FMN transferase